MTEEERQRNSYLRVPTYFIAIIVTISMQTGGAVWWASGANTKLNFLIENYKDLNKKLEERVKDRYTGTEASRDKAAAQADRDVLRGLIMDNKKEFDDLKYQLKYQRNVQ